MAEMKISNTLVNDTQAQIIAYARQLVDDGINWEKWGKIAQAFKIEDNKRQSKLNELFLQLHDDYHRFIEDAGPIDGVMDSWKEVSDFLESISDTQSLISILQPLYANQGMLAVELNPLVPGQLVASYASEDLALTDNSKLDQETGQLKLELEFTPEYPNSY